MTTNYVTKAQLIEKLSNDFKINQEELSKLSREELLNKLDEVMQKDIEEASKVLATTPVETIKTDTIIDTNPEVKESAIIFTSPKWSDFVMSNFSTGTELINNMPTCDGLRRVFQLLIGPIIECIIKVVKVPTTLDPSCTVECVLSYVDKRLGGQLRVISDVFDVNIHNTPYPWHLPSAATAATKAEARALRKGLGLQKVLSQEEALQGFDQIQVQNISKEGLDTNRGTITDTSKMVIRTMSNRLGIDITKLLKSLDISQSLDMVTQEIAQQIIKELQLYQNKPEDIKADIKNEVLM
jgi:hypothetical protein